MKTLLLAGLMHAAASSVVLNENFDAEVIHPTRSAFVLFFAPWCGHCKAMKPSWREFAKLHAGSAELLVGEVDCTASGGEAICGRYEVEGYPSLKFFEAGSAEPEDYEEQNNLDGFVRAAPSPRFRLRPDLARRRPSRHATPLPRSPSPSACWGLPARRRPWTRDSSSAQSAALPSAAAASHALDPLRPHCSLGSALAQPWLSLRLSTPAGALLRTARWWRATDCCRRRSVRPSRPSSPHRSRPPRSWCGHSN